jgi:hypothetical protein
VDLQKDREVGCSSYAVDIRPKFTDEDVLHMNDMVGMDLGSYETVRDNAELILERLQSASGPMPPPPRGPWSPEWIQCFRQWISEGKRP